MLTAVLIYIALGGCFILWLDRAKQPDEECAESWRWLIALAIWPLAFYWLIMIFRQLRREARR